MPKIEFSKDLSELRKMTNQEILMIATERSAKDLAADTSESNYHRWLTQEYWDLKNLCDMTERKWTQINLKISLRGDLCCEIRTIA